MTKLLIGLAVIAQIVFAPLAFAEQEDLENYNKAANKNGSVDLYGY